MLDTNTLLCFEMLALLVIGLYFCFLLFVLFCLQHAPNPHHVKPCAPVTGARPTSCPKLTAVGGKWLQLFRPQAAGLQQLVLARGRRQLEVVEAVERPIRPSDIAVHIFFNRTSSEFRQKASKRDDSGVNNHCTSPLHGSH